MYQYVTFVNNEKSLFPVLNAWNGLYFPGWILTDGAYI
jgi:hypothetical protein